MAELLPEECDCTDAEIDLIEGIEICDLCGRMSYISTERLNHLRQQQVEYDKWCEEQQHEEEMRALEDAAIEDHFRKYPHG